MCRVPWAIHILLISFVYFCAASPSKPQSTVGSLLLRARGTGLQSPNDQLWSGAKAMKNLSLTPPYNPQVRSNRDLANFYCNAEVA